MESHVVIIFVRRKCREGSTLQNGATSVPNQRKKIYVNVLSKVNFETKMEKCFFFFWFYEKNSKHMNSFKRRKKSWKQY